MKSIVITCNTIRAEIDLAISNTGYNQPVIFLESGLHNEPPKLQRVIQELLGRIANVDQVILLMGFCGNAVLGLKPKGFRLIIPRADDCITLLLGSEDKRKKIQREKPTYFLSKGWIDMFSNIERTTLDEFMRMERKYGSDRAKRLMASTIKHYKRMGVIDLGSFDIDEMISKANENLPSYMNELPYETINSSLDFIEGLLVGPWDNRDDCIIINDGEEVVFEKLYIK